MRSVLSLSSDTARWRILLRWALVIAVGVAVYQVGASGMYWMSSHLGVLHLRYGDVVLWLATGVFLVFQALPFVPGMEISLVLMLMFGAKGIVAVYLATLLALSTSYAAGRWMPPGVLVGLLDWLRLNRARAMVERLAPLTPEQRFEKLVQAAPSRIVPFLLRHRYLSLAVIWNVPGNAVVGGGGGIGLLAGLSGLFAFPAYVFTAFVAASPVPVLLLLTDLLS